MDNNSSIQEINQGLLNSLVQKALHRPAFQVTDWSAKTIYGGFELDSTLLRFQGEGKDSGEILPWSLILKAVKPSEKIIDPAGFRYWKREVLAYQSGLLQHLPGGNITAPVCYGVDERADGSIWVWMEDIKDDFKGCWPIDQYAIVARHLGQFNGAYLTGQAIPDAPWMAHNWLRLYVENAARMVEFIRMNPLHPVVRQLYSKTTLDHVLSIWEERDHILKALEAMPQVLCHQDAFKRNMFKRGGQTILIDWGFMGNAPVGAELAAFIIVPIWTFEIPADRVIEMDRLCFESYLGGLGDAGWNGEAQIVRKGYVITVLLRYIVAGQIGELLPALLDQEMRSKFNMAFETQSSATHGQANPALEVYLKLIYPEAFNLVGVM